MQRNADQIAALSALYQADREALPLRRPGTGLVALSIPYLVAITAVWAQRPEAIPLSLSALLPLPILLLACRTVIDLHRHTTRTRSLITLENDLAEAAGYEARDRHRIGFASDFYRNSSAPGHPHPQAQERRHMLLLIPELIVLPASMAIFTWVCVARSIPTGNGWIGWTIVYLVVGGGLLRTFISDTWPSHESLESSLRYARLRTARRRIRRRQAARRRTARSRPST